jgi:5-methyltetrahydrofolate--homocysteine methyltransferase
VEYDHYRDRFAAKIEKRQFLSLSAARANRLPTNWASYTPTQPPKLGVQTLIDFSLATLAEYIDWTPFFHTWELRAKYPRILEDEQYGEQAMLLFTDAKAMLQGFIESGDIKANAVFGLFPANSVDHDDIEIYTDKSRETIQTKVIGLRQQTVHATDSPNLSLSDFIAPRETSVNDTIGAFAVTAGIGLDEVVAKFDQEQDVYNSIMAKALADRLAEAFAEYLHEQIRKLHWGYASEESLDIQARIKEQYRGIRPAPGYPANPDHSQKELIWDLLEVEKHTQITLTETLAMLPASSISGWYFYAERQGIDDGAAEKCLAASIGYVDTPIASAKVA